MPDDAPDVDELLPDGVVLDEVDEGPAPDPARANRVSVQETIARQLGGVRCPVSARTFYSVADPFAHVLEWVRTGTGRQLGTLPVWLRCWREDIELGVVFTFSAPRPLDAAELIVVGMRGALSRAVIRGAAYRAFSIVGLRRVVARVPAERSDRAELLQGSRSRPT
ncbi:hypothetical protein [Methylobacterium sp. PvR107]|uniref:hypothetical protein n=1 Tax=Methylobacterium sp. PvR107 TaxID=2806597 RepID=UPI001AE6BBB9|nr:hypothetical protein [Methylobacterium sp. PvR107]MBP1183783.1 hypothetical protein [Methylobacterium sp. PvR107]